LTGGQLLLFFQKGRELQQVDSLDVFQIAFGAGFLKIPQSDFVALMRFFFLGQRDFTEELLDGIRNRACLTSTILSLQRQLDFPIVV
jgi:hypothetical protein